MIGIYSKDTTTVGQRDRSEYAIFSILFELREGFKEQGIPFSSDLLIGLRESLRSKMTDRPVDFTFEGVSVAQIKEVIESTGVTQFGNLGTKDQLDAGIARVWRASVAEHRREASRGNYLHVVTDPEFRTYVLDPSDDAGLRAQGVYRIEGQSFREMSHGDTVKLTSKSGKKDVYEGAIGEGYEENLFMGWHGGEVDGKRYRGISHVLGAYLSQVDGDRLAQTFDPNEMIDRVHADRALDLLTYLRSAGYDFNVIPSERPGQIDVEIDSVNRIQLRIYDAENNGQYIGRVYDRLGYYRLMKQGDTETQNASNYSVEDSRLILDYVMGNRRGKDAGRVVKYTGSDGARILFDELEDGRFIHLSPTENAYEATAYRSKEEAETYLIDAVNEVSAFVRTEFDIDGIEQTIHTLVENKGGQGITKAELHAELERVYSPNDTIRFEQEQAVSDIFEIEEIEREPGDYDGDVVTIISLNEEARANMETIRDSIVGDYESGFNPSFVIDYMSQTERRNGRDAIIAALKVAEYDLDKIKGNDFAVNTLKEQAISFNPDTAQTIDEVENERLKRAMLTVQQTLYDGGFRGGFSDFEHETRNRYIENPDVWVDDKGVIKWEGLRRLNRTGRSKGPRWEEISGEIGQVIVPDENGVIKTTFEGDNNYAFVPGYTGYFTFEGDYDNRMERFRVKGFDQHLEERLRSQVTHQMARPIIDGTDNISTVLDASSLNGLYHGDVYGKRIDMDFLETNQLKPEVKSAILTTLSNRVRFGNQFSDHATTSAETRAEMFQNQSEDTAAFSYYNVAGGRNMRVLYDDIENYADMTMTGTGKTQGLIWYLTDGASVNPDGSVTPSDGLYNDEGERVPDKTALKKLDYFKYEDNNAWDRTQMSANQLMTALRVDEGVKTAFMAFGGWTFDDSYVVSQEFADRNQVFGVEPNQKSMRVLDDLLRYEGSDTTSVDRETFKQDTGMMWSSDVIEQGVALQKATLSDDPDERMEARLLYDAFLSEHGRFRPLQRGDKLSDFGGNKGTIGIVIDRDMPEDQAKALKLDREVAFFKENPTLDVISAPYSMLSRHNAGVVKEAMEGEPETLVDPFTGEEYPAAMGELNLIVTDMVVDDKTKAYTEEDLLDGKGRKASGQLAWGLQAKDANAILDEFYGNNVSAWETYREYLIATGLDMNADGTIVKGYEPHFEEEREHFEYDPDVDAHDFLNEIKDQGGFLDLPFELSFKNGVTTNELPILSASLRQNVELVDGSMRRSDFTNHYRNIYESLGAYHAAETDEERAKHQRDIQYKYDQIQSRIISYQLDGSHNGKHSFIRDKIMSKRVENSATGVAIADPRREIGEAGMNQAMLDALGAKEGDTVMMFRDPVWRDGAIRAMTVVLDETANGVAFNPITDKSHDGDFDGDTYGLIKLNSKAANKELVEKFSHHANLIDKGSGKDELYFQSGMDLASAAAKAERDGDPRPQELMDRVEELAKSDDPRVQKQAIKALNEYSNISFRELSYGSDYINLESDESVFESFDRMVEHGAKGKPSVPADPKKGTPAVKGSAEEYREFHNGLKTNEDAQAVQYATGVKTDDTGFAGAFSQKLVSIMRNHDIMAALEAMYPVSQGTLQIKKDPDHARQVNRVLTDDLNKTFRGKVRGQYAKNKDLTPAAFKRQLKDILENDLKVDVAEEHIDTVTEVLTHEGKILPLTEAIEIKGAPMDRVGYGGGYECLNKIADEGKSLLDGKYNKMFAPRSMREADEKTKIAKRDTQRRVIEELVAEKEATEPTKEQEPLPNAEATAVATADGGPAI